MTMILTQGKASLETTGDMKSPAASYALEALRLLTEIARGLEFVPDGRGGMVGAFTATPDLHDEICAWGSFAEDDEDEGYEEECYRGHPRELARSTDHDPEPSQAASNSRLPLGSKGTALAPAMLSGAAARLLPPGARAALERIADPTLRAAIGLPLAA